jgi:TDG/mug DNA glycosylase family protein
MSSVEIFAAFPLSTGFPPISNTQARVLILGTLPGQASLAAVQYYAQKQNAFWKIISALTDSPLDLSYAQRKQLLLKNKIALWDVCKSAERKGSLDSNIKLATLIPNDFENFLGRHPKIRLICFNGQFAERIFRSKVQPTLSTQWSKIQFEILPSTSPGHAGMRFEKKLEHWRCAVGIRLS